MVTISPVAASMTATAAVSCIVPMSVGITASTRSPYHHRPAAGASEIDGPQQLAGRRVAGRGPRRTEVGRGDGVHHEVRHARPIVVECVVAGVVVAVDRDPGLVDEVGVAFGVALDPVERSVADTLDEPRRRPRATRRSARSAVARRSRSRRRRSGRACRRCSPARPRTAARPRRRSRRRARARIPCSVPSTSQTTVPSSVVGRGRRPVRPPQELTVRPDVDVGGVVTSVVVPPVEHRRRDRRRVTSVDAPIASATERRPRGRPLPAVVDRAEPGELQLVAVAPSEDRAADVAAPPPTSRRGAGATSPTRRAPARRRRGSSAAR